MITRGPWLFSATVALAALGCGGSGEGVPQNTCVDGVAEQDCSLLQAVILPDSLPAALGNAHAEEFNASLLGFHVFFDSRFSENLNVRCESCHSVDYGFSDNRPVPVAGIGHGVRNSPTIFNAARYTTFFWDGRADTLWSQPLFAFENPDEMDFTRLEIVHLLNAVYSAEYTSAFGPLPDFSDLKRFPARGKPGDAAYEAMAPVDQQSVNTVVANIGKALEAYMRRVATGPSVVDSYLKGKFGTPGAAPITLTARQERGVAVFVNSGCLQCHSGPQLSDNQFHNLGVAAVAEQAPDAGRSQAAIATLAENPFNAKGPFFDDSAPLEIDAAPVVLGGFRTPSLRNLPKSAPYGHNGSFATLEDVVDFHLQGGGRGSGGFVGEVDSLIQPTPTSADDRAALIEFLKALAGSYPALPWGQWPSGNG